VKFRKFNMTKTLTIEPAQQMLTVQKNLRPVLKNGFEE
jgi:hypothetical protein